MEMEEEARARGLRTATCTHAPKKRGVQRLLCHVGRMLADLKRELTRPRNQQQSTVASCITRLWPGKTSNLHISRACETTSIETSHDHWWHDGYRSGSTLFYIACIRHSMQASMRDPMKDLCTRPAGAETCWDGLAPRSVPSTTPLSTMASKMRRSLQQRRHAIMKSLRILSEKEWVEGSCWWVKSKNALAERSPPQNSPTSCRPSIH